MKTLSRSRSFTFALLGMALGGLLLTTGCFSTEAGVDAEAEIAGVLQGDAEAGSTLAKSAAEVEGAVVTVHEVAVDGQLGPAVAQTQTDAQGSFTLKTDLEGKRRLIVRAVRQGKEWKARLEDEMTAGASRVCRPLNLESTLEAEVWLELQKTAPGRAVYPHEGTASMDAEVAASVHAEYRSPDSAARAALIARLASATRAASQARAAAMASVAVRAEQAAQASLAAEAEFRARLHAAARDTAEIRAARAAFLRAVAQAHVDAEVKATTYARASEAAYRATVRAAVTFSDSARAAVARNCARSLAVASDIALQAQLRASGAAEAHVDNVAEAGVRFMAAVEAAASKEACDSAMSHYRTEAKAAFDSAHASVSVAIQALSSALDSLSATLEAQVGAEAGASETGEAYMNAQATASAQIMTALGSMDDQTEAEAVADAVAFLSVRPRN